MPVSACQLGLRGLELHQDPPRPRHEQLARVGQRHAPRRPLDQREADLVLQPPDLLRERRLGDVLARRRAREVALLRERDEIAQLAQFHSYSL